MAVRKKAPLGRVARASSGARNSALAGSKSIQSSKPATKVARPAAKVAKPAAKAAKPAKPAASVAKPAAKPAKAAAKASTGLQAATVAAAKPAARAAKALATAKNVAKKTVNPIAPKTARSGAAQPSRAAAKAPAAPRSPKPAAQLDDTPPPSSRLTEGSLAPEFALPDQDASVFASSSLQGRPYVLYFYPKDDTPGCTKEACDFRDALARFASSGVEILGVSPDPAGSHARFRSKYGLNFRLLSDSDKQLAKAYGVWVKKQNYGREYMGIERSTFLVDREGVVRRAWRGVRVPGHIEQVLSEASGLAG